MESKYKILALVQARMGSTRCPGKSLAKIQNYKVVELVLKRLLKSQKVRDIVLITSKKKEDVRLANFVNKIGFKTFLGSEKDLVSRFIKSFDNFSNKNDKFFLRVAADNPFLCWKEVDRLIVQGLKCKADFCSYINHTFPDRNNDFAGEFININALKRLSKLTKNKFDREHVYPFFLNNNKTFKVKRVEVSKSLKTLIKFDLDYKEDLKFFRKIGKKTNKKIINLSSKDIIKIGKKIKNV